ncbi:hypothetical protein [Chitinophaga cymbidii]|uniref:DUF2157 domain-containing protein n=1 Tax=Chitinophaga cymbidii TaxID=1096750 RepID=A0A512RRH1_9BACT|nr:hypothetical protein [Chitinophaga cymbidii]GEP98298.1 hypothetical protein CCY01nite_45580 [Chitinophaga cymbidii]
MIAYDQASLDNRLIQQEVETTCRKQCITEAEKAAVLHACPVRFYTPNPFIRIGLFIATAVIGVSVFGMCILLLTVGSSTESVTALTFFFSFLFYLALEMFVRVKHHFASGVDDALMWMSGAFMLSGFFIATDFDLDDAWIYMLIFVAGTLFTLRFANVLMCAVAFAGFIAMIFFTCFHLGSTAQTLLPFVVMGLSLLLYRLSARFLREQRFRHYFGCLEILSILSLITFYLAGNYYVVREIGEEMFRAPMRLGWLFWIFTVAVPTAYIYLGIRRRNLALLRVGLLLTGAVVFTVRYYYGILPAELAMSVGGAVVIALAWYVTHYLKEPKAGFTREDDDEHDDVEKLQIESLVIAETFHETPKPPQGFRFGGGSGGGGGAGSDY